MSDVTLFNYDGIHKKDVSQSQPQVFNFKNNKIRVILENGEPLFLGADVADALCYDKKSKMYERLDDDEKVVKNPKNTQSSILELPENVNKVIFLTEAGLYNAILGSTKPEAKEFKKWVTGEVLPSIRKTGSYSAQHKLPQTYAEALLEAGRLALENEKLLAEAKENAPKVECYNKIMDSKDAIDFLTFSKLAKIGRNTLFKKCRELKILMSNNMPYQEFIDIGYFRVVESSYRQYDESKIYTKTLILPKGQAFLLKKLKLKKED